MVTEDGQDTAAVDSGCDSATRSQPVMVTDIESFASALQGLPENELRWFRGQTSASWGLMPSIARKRQWIENESEMLRRFIQDAAPRMSEKPENLWDWVSTAQHHSLPTRLLDWTENPLIGLFFAVESDAIDGEMVDGAVWILNVTALNSSSFPDARGPLMLGHDRELDTYLPGMKSPKMEPVATIAARTFGRIVAQRGVFTVSHGSDLRPIETVVPAAFERWVIPMTKKQSIRDSLNLLGVNASTVYPDLDHLGNHIRSIQR